MKRIIVLTLALLLSASAHAASHWQSLSFRVDPQNVAKIQAAIDKFMSSPAGQMMPGTLSLMASVIDGGDPSTHSVITSMESLAAREAWTGNMQGNPDWNALRDTVSSLSDLGATSRMVFLKSWGDAGDTDVVWHIHALKVNDGPAYLAALDKLRTSETGMKAPGSLHLSAVAASGLTPVTHLVSVGYDNEAEGEAWNDTLRQSAEWAAFQKATASNAERLGTFVLRTIKTWGTPTPTP